ncbi:MAG: PilZ domain-containing protein [Candidatus Zixiibacteriota bacterium]|nr:MAG: PilZ domain-containing protein [candidate division Zixibacteria bacterium]
MPKQPTTPRRGIRRRTSDYYIVTDNRSGQILGRLADLSLEGFKIITNEELTESSYDCQLSLPRCVGNVKEIPLQASVKWCRHITRMDWYEAGFKIDQISAPSREVLQQIMGEMLRAESTELNL